MKTIPIHLTGKIHEVELRYKRANIANMCRISGSADMEKLFRHFYNEYQIDYVESFYCAYLNNNNRVLGVIKISQGSETSTLVPLKPLVVSALLLHATAVVISHNHPSGVLKPSNADIEITKKIKHALSLIDVRLLDHIILTSESSYSFADNGELS